MDMSGCFCDRVLSDRKTQFEISPDKEAVVNKYNHTIEE